MNSNRFLLSQLLKLLFQTLLYGLIFLSFYLMLSLNNPQMLNLSRTAVIIVVTYFVILLILTYVYGGYDLGVRKARSVCASVLVAVYISDVTAYLALQIMNVNPANNQTLVLGGEDLLLLLVAMALQSLFIYLFVAFGYHLYFRINPPQRCCIVTSSQELAEHVTDKIATFRQRYKLCDVVHYECPDVYDTILQHETVFLAGIPDTEEALLQSFCYKHGKSIYLLAELEDVIISTARQNIIDDTPFLYVPPFEMTLMQRFIKRSSDVLLSVLCLLVCSPIMLAAAGCIFFAHNGPIFFRQKRATIGGRVFEIIKFRTMYVESREVEQTVGSARKDDARITPVGRVLRKFRVDELPQLFNILKGDMSFVGPRPEMLENVNRYTQEVPEFAYRQQMKAGLTGLAQIDGKYNTTPKDKVILDLLYIETFSILQDIKLLLRTLTVFFRKDSTEGFANGKRARKYLKMRTEAAAIPDAASPSSAASATPPTDAASPIQSVS